MFMKYRISCDGQDVFSADNVYLQNMYGNNPYKDLRKTYKLEYLIENYVG